MKSDSIAVLLATYRPRIDWLAEQLTSLNQQTYPSLHLYVLDDASPKDSYRAICQTVEKCIHQFPVTVLRNDQNQGSNQTFARLLTLAKEEAYVAFCDQDDVWFPNKIQNALHLLKRVLCTQHLFMQMRTSSIPKVPSSPPLSVHTESDTCRCVARGLRDRYSTAILSLAVRF